MIIKLFLFGLLWLAVWYVLYNIILWAFATLNAARPSQRQQKHAGAYLEELKRAAAASKPQRPRYPDAQRNDAAQSSQQPEPGTERWHLDKRNLEHKETMEGIRNVAADMKAAQRKPDGFEKY
jgi:hypothetical protein